MADFTDSWPIQWPECDAGRSFWLQWVDWFGTRGRIAELDGI